MMMHLAEYHPGTERSSIPESSRFEVIRRFDSPMYRQIFEAMKVANFPGVLMNKKDEYSRCYIPSLKLTMPGITKLPEKAPVTGKSQPQPDDCFEYLA